jgi:glutamine amidotransferase
MREPGSGRVVIVDYGMGNVFSVEQACRATGLASVVSSAREDLLAADAVILPGVGAFGDAMAALRRLDLIEPLKEFAQSSRPLMGICLGMQLLMTEGSEFGRHPGLGLIVGTVERLPSDLIGDRRLKVPHIGWTRIVRQGHASGLAGEHGASFDSWRESLLAGLRNGEFMYFVHSYYVVPDDRRTVLALSRHGEIEFCSAVGTGPIFGCQFHPERSGPAGLAVYQNLAAAISHHLDPIG